MAYLRKLRRTRKRGMGRGTGGLRRKVVKLAAVVKKTAPELHYTDYNVTDRKPVAAGDIINLTSFQTVGDNNTNRTGSKININGLQMKFRVTTDTETDIQQSSAVRVIIFKGKHENQVAYTPSDILRAVGSKQSLIGPYNHDDRNRFTIVCDKTVILASGNNNALSAGWQSDMLFQCNKGFKGHKVIYATTTTNVEHGGLYLMYMSDSATTEGAPLLHYGGRLTFYAE